MSAMILVACALAAELPGFTAPEGVELLATGVGPVEAAAAVARRLASAPFDCLINAGIAGGFRGRTQLGEAVLVAEERLAELGLESGEPLRLPGGARLADRAFAADALLERLQGLPLRTGSGVTVSQVTTTDATAARLREQFDPDVESMEGFAVLRAAELAGVPALEVRGISNYVGAREQSEWNFAAGARAASGALAAILERLRA